MDATRSRYGIWAGVIALLALHVGLALWAAAKETVTSDEIFHVTGGYFYNKYGDYRVQPENGNLPQRVAVFRDFLVAELPAQLGGQAG